MNRVLKTYLFLLLLSPAISYYTQINLGISSNTVFGILAYPLLLVVLFFKASLKKEVNLSAFILPGLLMGIYFFIWGFYNGKFEEGGWQLTLLNNRWLQSTAILTLIYNTKFSKKFINYSITLLKITVIISLIITIIQIVYSPRFFTPQSISFDRYHVFGSVVLNRRDSLFTFLPDEIDYTFIPLVALLLGHQLYYKKKNNIMWIILVSIVAIGSNSRTTMAAFITSTVVYLFDQKDKFKKTFRYVFAALLLVIITVSAFVGMGYNWKDFKDNRLLSTSGQSRINAFIAVFQHPPSNLLFGMGGMTLSKDINWKLQILGGTQIHNGHLAQFVYYGITGFTLVMWFYYLIVKKLLKNAKSTQFYASLIGFIIFLQIQMTTIPFGGIFAYGLLYCFIFDKYFIDKKEKMFYNYE